MNPVVDLSRYPIEFQYEYEYFMRGLPDDPDALRRVCSIMFCQNLEQRLEQRSPQLPPIPRNPAALKLGVSDGLYRLIRHQVEAVQRQVNDIELKLYGLRVEAGRQRRYGQPGLALVLDREWERLDVSRSILIAELRGWLARQGDLVLSCAHGDRHVELGVCRRHGK
ncbi:hypothetical protein GS597_01310 [Synechococcales cyanobacterium C]|uniref:Uncharacterized protein n=1 Tax=Petrachloros mirabilis ULC683 TaxID=2781853 RepID=A0A8K1ZWI8_9CYAN|nr:hypothetical protein [Petrachloros mirabilis]NCJ05177.1 hypothetical protein [Petrachloros mirabilis ULC683]